MEREDLGSDRLYWSLPFVRGSFRNAVQERSHRIGLTLGSLYPCDACSHDAKLRGGASVKTPSAISRVSPPVDPISATDDPVRHTQRVVGTLTGSSSDFPAAPCRFIDLLVIPRLMQCLVNHENDGWLIYCRYRVLALSIFPNGTSHCAPFNSRHLPGSIPLVSLWVFAAVANHGPTGALACSVSIMCYRMITIGAELLHARVNEGDLLGKRRPEDATSSRCTWVVRRMLSRNVRS